MNDYEFDDLFLGMRHSFERKIEEEDLQRFSDFTGDNNPLHMDENYASGSPFGRRVVHGLLLSSYLSTLAGVFLPGKHSLILNLNIDMKKPAFIGDLVEVIGEVSQKINSINLAVLKVKIINQKKMVLQEGTMKIKVLK